MRYARLWHIEGTVYPAVHGGAPATERAVRKLVVSDEIPSYETVIVCLETAIGRARRPAQITKVVRGDDVLVP